MSLRPSVGEVRENELEAKINGGGIQFMLTQLRNIRFSPADLTVRCMHPDALSPLDPFQGERITERFVKSGWRAMS